MICSKCGNIFCTCPLLGKKELAKLMCDYLGFKIPLRDIKYVKNYFDFKEMVKCSVCYGGVCVDGSICFYTYGD